MLISQGKTAEEASRTLGISEQTYYRWRKEYGVGTEQVYRLKELEKETMSDMQLMNYFKFDEADLEVNRSGHLTEKQKTRLTKIDKSDKMWHGIIPTFYILFLGAACLYVFYYWNVMIRNWSIRIISDIFCVPFFLTVLYGVSTAVVETANRIFSKPQVKLQRAEGPINIVKREWMSDDFICEMHVGDEIFKVTPDLADIMIQGNIYAVYYAECSITYKGHAIAVDSSKGSVGEILSAELIEKAK